MMVIKDVKREARSTRFLLDKYETKQPGEVNPANLNLMKEWRESQRIRIAKKQMEDLNVQGDLKKQVIWIIKEGPGTKELCARCKCETVTLAIIFYIKFSNTKKRPMAHYKIARDTGLSEEVYANIVTKLGKFFQGKMALTGRIRRNDDY